jgi:hypothetical protein
MRTFELSSSKLIWLSLRYRLSITLRQSGKPPSRITIYALSMRTPLRIVRSDPAQEAHFGARRWELLAKTPIDAESRERIRGFIENDFK